MIRYRCPHCALLTAAHERRVGQASVCKACLKPHQIPTDVALWLTETGEPLHPPVAAATPAPIVELVPEPELTHAAESEPAPEPVVVISAVQEPEPAVDKPAPEPVVPPEPAAERLPVVRVLAPRALEAPEPEIEHAHEAERATQTATAISDEPEDAPAAAATVTPLPQPAWKLPGTPPPPARQNRPAPAFPGAGSNTPPPRHAEPVQLQTQADIAAALTTALTARMKPRAAPRRDLRPSTALWMLLTGVGAGFFLVSLFAAINNRWVALVVGAVQIALGYGWIVRLTHMRDPKRGQLCAIPFVTPYYLAQHKYARFRPLRFVLTGAALVALALAAPPLAALINPLVPRATPAPPPPDISTQPKLTQLRAYRDRGDYDNLVKTLAVLVKTDPARSTDAPNHPELAVELEALCKHADRAVRLEAMSAFVSWDLDPDAGKARRVCLDAIRSPSEDERVRALFLLPHWKDPETARAAQSLIGRPSRQTNQAKKSLEEIGGVHAERAAVALLQRADDATVRLVAIDILAKIGGPFALDRLEEYARTTDDLGARNSALTAINVIRERARTPDQ